MNGRPLRLAVSGTYSSGKTTTTEVLSVATGMQRTDALTAREIMVDLAPGKRFQDLSAEDLLALGLRRFEERINGEATTEGAFISDGSVLHEWVYGEARLRLGLNPGAPLLHRAAKRVVGLPARPFMRRYMNAYGTVTKARALRTYDAFVHLPLQFAMAVDGHRPVSEEYRHMCDTLLLETIRSLGLRHYVVGGTIRERVEQIIDIFDLPVHVEITEAIDIATYRISRSKEMLAEKQIANQVGQPLSRRITQAIQY